MVRPLVSIAVLLALAGDARAESVPEFSLDYAKEKATHIVVVGKDGKVLESWRGNLKPGEALPFKAAEKPLAVVEVAGLLESKVKAVMGERRVLFLIKDGGGRGFDRRPVTWLPAGYLKPEISLATVWIEEGECFAIYQWMNPGDGAHLHPLNMTEERLRREVTPDETEPK
jgi:hypothetical protein